MRRAGLTKDAPRLLRSVNGKAHAGWEDHEETFQRRGGGNAAPRPAAGKRSTVDLTEEQVTMDPISSDDEDNGAQRSDSNPPTPRESQTSASSGTTGRGGKKKVDGGGRVKKTPARKGLIAVPRHGNFARGKAHKNGEEEKENVGGTSAPSSSATTDSALLKRSCEAIFPGMHAPAPKAVKTYASQSKPSASNNIHAPAKSKMANKRIPAKTVGYGRRSKLPPQDDGDSDVSMKDGEDDPAAALDALNKRAQKSKAPEPPPSPPKPKRPNLLASLGAYKQPDSSPPDPEEYDPADPSSAPASQSLTQDRETLASLEQHVRDLPPEEDPNATCPLCQEPVDSEHQESFWKWHNKTVKNQSLFCTAHRVRTAQTRYEDLGFPTIDWDALPQRIKEFRPQLVALLRNETGTESKYRKQHASKLLSGKAATVPTRKQGQKREDVEAELEHFDDMPASTGHYGPRGRRIMMETITSDLSDVIREVAVDDPVIGRSGFAIYVQAVLVPELTVLLVKQDFDCSEKRAEELVEQGAELGALLHEEIDDVVEAQSDDEDDADADFWNVDDDEKYEALPVGGKKKPNKQPNPSQEKPKDAKKKTDAKAKVTANKEEGKPNKSAFLRELADTSDSDSSGLSDVPE